jgi:hypothetical protein
MSRALMAAAVSMIVLAIGGCVSPEEQSAQDRAQCAGFGFVEGTDAFANCMMKAARVRDDRQREDTARWRAENERERERREYEERKREEERRRPPLTPSGASGGIRQVDAGPIFSDISAQNICPQVCGGRANWDGNWRTVSPGRSTCDCR